MAQIFHPATNTIARISLLGAVLLLAALGWIWGAILRSPYATQAGVAREQPVPFSHKHHVLDIGIDCRHCHDSVEESAFAGIPSTALCMNCHSQIWSDSPMLEPIRASFREGAPIRWTRVHDLPDFVYFHHGIHVNKGIGCATCHGPVDHMPLTWREKSLHMDWCLECHRNPELYVRPRHEVFNMAWSPGPEHVRFGEELVSAYGIAEISDCSICHR